MFPNGPWDSRWQILHKIGSGGSGTTYRAVDKTSETGAVCALKIIHPGRHKDPLRRVRMMTEARALSGLSLPGVPRLLDTNCAPETTGKLYVAMEYVEGPTLETYVAKHGPLPIRDAVRLAISLIRTVDDVHRAGIGHRDIKHDNVVLRGGDPAHPVLVDFGQAFHSEDDGVVATSGGQQMGNRFLHLPELISGDKRDLRADLVLCSAVLFYAATGRVPGSLDDGEGRMPQEQPAATHCLREIQEPQRSRLTTVLARSFDTLAGRRWQTGPSLEAAVQWITAPPPKRVPLGVYVLALSAGLTIRRRPWLRVVSVLAVVVCAVGIPLLKYESAARSRAEEGTRAYALLGRAREALEHDPTMAVALLKGMPMKSPWDSAVRIVGEDALRQGVAWRVVPPEPDTGSRSSFRLELDDKGNHLALVDDMAWSGRQIVLSTGQIVGTRQESAVLFITDGILVGSADGTVELRRATGLTSHVKLAQAVARILPWRGATYLLREKWGPLSVWDPATGGVQKVASPPVESISSRVGLRDAGVVAFGTKTGLVYLSDGELSSYRREFDLGGEVLALAPDPSGRALLAWSRTGRMAVWSSDPASSGVWMADVGVLRAGALAADRAIWLNDAGEVWVRSNNPESQRRLFTIDRLQLLDVAMFSPNAGYLFVARSNNGEVYDVNAGGAVAFVLRGHANRIEQATFDGEERVLITASADREVRAWHLSRRADREVRMGADVNGLEVDPEGRRVAIVAGSGFAVWDLADDTLLRDLGAGGRASIAGWSSDGSEVLYSVGADLRRWSGGKRDAGVLARLRSEPRVIRCAPDLRTVVWADDENRAWVLRFGDGEARELKGPSGFRAGTVEVNATGVIVAAGQDGRIVAWRPDVLEGVEIPRHNAQVVWLASSIDGRYFASQSVDGEVRLWTDECRSHTVLSKQATIRGRLRFSPGGLLTWSESDRTVRVWPKGDIWSFGGQGVGVNSASVDDARGLLAAGGDGGEVIVWDLRSDFRRRILAHRFGVLDAQFAHGELITYGQDKVVRAWKDLLPMAVKEFGVAFDDATNASVDPVSGLLAGWRRGE